MRALFLAAWLLCVTGWPTSSARAQSASEEVERGQQQFQDLEFAGAITTLQAVVDNEELSDSERLLALELLAISHLSLGQRNQASDAFRKLLELRPDYKLRNHEGSPKVVSLFEKVRKSMGEPDKVEPETAGDVDPGETGETGEARAKTTRLRLSKKSEGPRAGARWTFVVDTAGPEPKEVILHWRGERTGQSYALASLRRLRKGRWRARVELPEQVGDRILYYVEALGVAGEVVARLGSPSSLEEIAVSGARARGVATPWYKRWSVWVGVGVAVAGGTALLLNDSDADPAQGSLSPGRIKLTP